MQLRLPLSLLLIIFRFLDDDCCFLLVSGYSEESTATGTVSIGMTCRSDKTADLV